MSISITFAQFDAMVPVILTGDESDLYSCLIRGRHGVGKSWVAYQSAAKLTWDADNGKTRLRQGDEKPLPVVEQRASQMTEGDLLGMPSPEFIEVNGEQASVFRPFAWFIQACTSPCVLFFD